MHALIVLSHPEPRSYNGHLKDVAVQALEAGGHTVDVSDLYAQEFDPVEGPRHYPDRIMPGHFSAMAEQRHAFAQGTLPADVAREIERLKRADLVVLQFPLWNHGVPAMLKGWFDRVFVGGGLYTSTMRYDRGFFRGRRAVLSVTTGAPEHVFGPGSRGGDMDHMLWPVNYSLHYMGYTILPPFAAYGVQGHGFTYQDEASAKASLERYAAQWADRLRNLDAQAPLRFPGWDDWDADGRALAARATA